jgi:4a-hydroxytetrahydrobiopterin dehydratase
MADQASAAAPDEKLTRTAASEAVGPLGWRYLLGNLVASVPVDSLAQAATVAAVATAACGALADQHLRLDLRPDRVELSLVDRNGTWATSRDAGLAAAITDALAGIGLVPAPPVTDRGRRPVQMLEIAIDAMDIAAIRPFWKAVLGYADEPGNAGPQEAIVDPVWETPAIWFQQMDAPRPQRNRIHFDVTVAHDEAQARVKAALAAGGRLVSEAGAPSFWVLADPEGNEACVCTWLGRDERA